METYQIAVVGGGMVGAALALGLAQQGKKVVLLESHQPQSFESSQPMDVRVSAISMASVQLLESLGVWQHIEAMRVCPYRRLETWESSECRTCFDAHDIGLEQLGYMVENRIIQLGIWQAFAQHPHLTVKCPNRLKSIEFGAEENRLVLDDDQVIHAQWIVGADGAHSQVRDFARIGVTAWDYRQHCMLIHVKTVLSQQDVTWQRFYPSGPRSFLPLNGHQASLVWYDSPRRIRQLSQLSPKQLVQEIQTHFPEELGEVEVIQHGSFALTRRHAQKYVANRCILVGDAAHTINPLAGQGVNLGFKDVKALLTQISESRQLDEKVFVRYERCRRPDNLLMQTGMDVFYKTFSCRHTPVKVVRNAVLKLANHAGPLKNQVLRYAIGLS
ncbi:2-octaprenyl-3-methyl-6-methoxy-1,4-benzoquinol hydroxylase [Vibrio mangrovi]|uniref:2-octaprenyl-3-methyl-6-methoxy-1,4-benzoquinol hydroxylase n=1 Tax=Vibrio mangrovi TaxID=474394 RepID=A0A1Y6ISM6_9VIBR|nr:2-octaprenyl-3-methyl-6-methoxy-1,4-benzoquinol hydroxylase [Vibrio mangrovi]MDW6003419.1 2-octaprenyl-3-methyl-6-methoxy-1,4-benzoquinol hydroxylase [Vibrio mangrovi]SMR99790.1 2-octaprenyl-3-methyl-6-methoxy-1,4-benzoquinol hydroxylase [Vibrio mangrovi]